MRWGTWATMLLLSRSLIQPWVTRAGEMMHCDAALPCGMAPGVGSCHRWEFPLVAVTDLDVVPPQHLEVHQCCWQCLMRHSCEIISLTPAWLYGYIPAWPKLSHPFLPTSHPGCHPAQHFNPVTSSLVFLSIGRKEAWHSLG